MKKTLVLLTLLLILPACKKDGENKTDNDISALPPALVVDGTPLDPMCFSDIIIMNEPQPDMAVRQCGDGLDVKLREVKDDGRTHFGSYRFGGDTDGSMGMPYTQYTYIGETGGNSVVLLDWSGGGTGHFTSILKLKREGDRLKIAGMIPGGDRCNGGLTNVAVNAQGRVTYERALTPYDMVLAGGAPDRPVMQSVKGYDDLDGCAVCCYGSAKFAEEEFISVKIAPNLKEVMTDKAPSLKEKQQCLDRQLRDTIDSGKTNFSAAEWQEYIVGKVEKSCLDLVGE